MWQQFTTAPDSKNEAEKTFQVVHPFHPLYGQEYKLIDVRHLWGLKRVYYYEDGHASPKSLPLSWTSLQLPDSFVICAQERSPFRVQDLIELASLLKKILSSQGQEHV
ncbi:MAG: Y4bD/Y4pK family protein [Alphaproteobacteria bacterium]|nr:Y4bD/Y4pK family protein [Alphaproteobacteria bacterium]